MFFIISKILSFLINPLLWILSLLLVAWKVKNEYIKQRLLKITVLFFLIFSNPFLFNEVMQLWETPAVAVSSLSNYDAGIVLGTTLQYDAKLDRVQFFQTGDRLFQAIELYKKGIIKKIVYSGGSGKILHQDDKEGIWVRRYLITIGIPEVDICIENDSRNTHENATLTKPLLDSIAHDGNFLLITSASHMRRSIKCFKKQGIHVEAYSTDRISGLRSFEINRFILPNTNVLSGWYVLNHELVGMIIYKFAGYV